MRYIELNPVRANMVEHPGEYKWSSCSANAQNGYDGLIERHPTYLELGAVDEDWKTAYRELFRNYIDSDTLHEIRESLNHELVPGRSYFKDKIEDITTNKHDWAYRAGQ